MKVVYLTMRSPHEALKGDQLIAHNQLKSIYRKKDKIYLITFNEYSKKNKLSEEDIKKDLKNYCEEVYIIKQSNKKKIINALRVFINGKPIQVNMFFDMKIKKEILNIINNINPDIIHVQTIRGAEYVEDIDKPKTLDMIDLLSLNMERRAQKENIVLKPIFKLESSLLEKYEKKMIKIFDKIFLVSDKEKQILNSNNVVVNPNGVGRNNRMKNSNHKEDIIVFHGNMGYFPNAEAVNMFCKDIWPEVHKLYPNYKFYIVGNNPSQSVIKLGGKNNIVVTGFVENIYEYLDKAKIGVYPLSAGTGMQNKILEALISGLPTVTTKFAIQGIKDISNKETLICNTKEEIISNIKNLIENEDNRKNIAENGIEFVKDKFSWKRNCDILQNQWSDIYKK
ncbi:glycosyltransferase family 4 protein [Clostridium sp.]|uniref:glycosyltransferase family 4 protein n=1 Tax=Clostridium sp. TaxID=1506 RepID=UPI00321643E8